MGCAPSLPNFPGQSGFLRNRHAAASETAAETPAVCGENNGGSARDMATQQNVKTEDKLNQNAVFTAVHSKKNQDVRMGSIRRKPDNLKVLLVFAREDSQSSAWVCAARKLGHQVDLLRAGHHQQLLQHLQQHKSDVVIIDRRLPSRALLADTFCSAIRSTCGDVLPVVVAIVKRSFLEKEESPVANLLQLGYDRFCAENSSTGACVNELLLIETSELVNRSRMQFSRCLTTALDWTKEMVTITDVEGHILYLNSSAEKLLGFSHQEMLGKNLMEVHKTDSGRFDIADALSQAAARTSGEWEGTCLCRRKTGDTVPLYSRIVMASSTSSQSDCADHAIILQELPPLFADKSLSCDAGTDQLGRNSLPSARKASYDVRSLGSDGAAIRRQSLARLHSMAIEAPITKVINIITAAQESSPIYISQALDKVLEILRSTELYAPQVSDSKGKPEDPVTTDLLGALLLGQKTIGYTRRSSSESMSKSHQGLHSRPLLASLSNLTTPIQIRELLEHDSSWEFDVIRLEKLTGRRPLVWLGMTIMTRFEMQRTLNCDEATLQNWLSVIEANYHATNTYHNSTHAADVLQATAYFLQKNRIKMLFDSLDEAACLIAAAVHDIDHPGKTSGFLCNSGSDLAILYNDLSVLESHHSALAFKLTLSDERINIFKGLDRDTFKMLRQSIIDMVLATEMTKHFEHLSKFVNIFTKSGVREDDPSFLEDLDYQSLSTPENITLVKRVLIKCADVSNPTRPLSLCVEWARRIAEEYFSQTAEEKAKGLPVVMPQFDRQTCSIPKSQIGFTDYFISDMFEAWDAFAETPELLQHVKRNYQFWKDQDALGVTGIPQEFLSSLTPTDLGRKTEFETLAEAKETQDT